MAQWWKELRFVWAGLVTPLLQANATPEANGKGYRGARGYLAQVAFFWRWVFGGGMMI